MLTSFGLLLFLNIAAQEAKIPQPRPAKYVQTWKCRNVTWKPAEHNLMKRQLDSAKSCGDDP